MTTSHRVEPVEVCRPAGESPRKTSLPLPPALLGYRRLLWAIALGVFFVVCSAHRLIAEGPPSSASEALSDLTAAFEAARHEDVPTFAPTLYSAAASLFHQAETAERNCEPVENVRAAMARAQEALKKAIRAGETAEGILSEATRARAQAKSYPFVTLLSEKLEQAEAAYRTALSQAEAGDLAAATNSAFQAVNLYRELTLQGLRNGPLAEARLLLEKNEARLSQAVLAGKLAELAALEASVQKTEGEPFEIRTYVQLTQEGIKGIVTALFPIFYTTLPEKLLIGDFTIVVESYETGGIYNFTTKEIAKLTGLGRIKFQCGPPKIVPWWWKTLITKPYDFVVVQNVADSATQIAASDAVVIDPKLKIGSKLTLELPEPKDELVDIVKAKVELIDYWKGIFGGIRVRFEDLTIAVTADPKIGLVKAGSAVYPSTPPIPPVPAKLYVSGFVLEIDQLHLTPVQAQAKARLYLPDSLAAGSECRSAWLDLGTIDISAKCEFYKELPSEGYGPLEIGNTTLLLSGTGYVADFSLAKSYPVGGFAPSWKGALLFNGSTSGQPTGTVTSNIGYLQAPFTCPLAVVTSAGLGGVFTSSSGYAYSALQPFGYDIRFNSAVIALSQSKVTTGKLQNGRIFLPMAAIRDAGSGPIRGKFETLNVQSDMDLVGEVEIGERLYWGELARTTPELVAYSAANPGSPGSPRKALAYFSAAPRNAYLPLSGSSFVEPSVPSMGAELETRGIQGVTFVGLDDFWIHTSDIPDPPPLKFKNAFVNEGVLSWLNVAARGVHGSMKVVVREKLLLKLGPKGSPQYKGKVPFETVLVGGAPVKYTPIVIDFVDSAVFRSDVRGHLKLEGPSKIELPFKEMLFTSTAHNAGGKVDLSTPLTLDYWGVGLVGKPGFPSAGLVSVKTGQVVFTAAGITEKRHYPQPFFLTWGVMLASGDLDRFVFDYNTAGQQFDGFHFVPQAIALSNYNPTPEPNGYLKACGFTHFPFYGPTYLNIQDWKDPSKPGPPEDGRKITLSSDSEFACTPSDLTVAASWSDGFGSFAYTIAYSDTDQNGFVGTGKASLLYLAGGDMSSTLVLKSTGICMSMIESTPRLLAFGPVANFGGLTNIWGCACVKGDQLERAVVGGDISAAANVSAVVRAGVGLSALLSITPSVTQLTMDGEGYLSLIASVDIMANGHFGLKIDRVNSFVEGDVSGLFRIATPLSSVQANGQVNWHLGAGVTGGHYQSLQGKLAVNVLGIGAEGGFYFGVNAPKSEAWVLTGANPKYKLNTSALPAHLTGVYAFVQYTAGVNLYVFSGSYQVYAGLGLFSLDAGQVASLGAQSSGLPVALFLIGNLGGSLHGEILGGFVSATAYFNLQIIGPYPGSFQGTVGLEGCVVWVACKSVDVTVGLNTADGFYLD